MMLAIAHRSNCLRSRYSIHQPTKANGDNTKAIIRISPISTFLASLALALLLTTMAIPAQAECGIASQYGEGSRTATGEHYNPWGITAAHRTRPLGSHVRVKNMKTGRELTVRLNDRGPYCCKNSQRILDLSLGSAKLLGINGLGFICIY